LTKLEELESKLRKRYKEIALDDDYRVYFLLESGMVIHLVLLKKFNAIVIEYADSLDEAKRYLFEDGDLFCIEDYPDVDEMFNDMIKEIES
jgi:hypothetical protein